MSWNIQKPGDYINGPLTVVGDATFNSNIGMGTTVSPWGSGFRVIEFPFGSCFFVNRFVANPNMSANAYINSSLQNIYKGNGYATSYGQYNGAHSWYTAASGVAGAEITDFASAKMTLAQAGLLTLSRATAGVGLEVYNSTTYSQIRLQSSGTNQSSYLTFNPTGTGKAIIQMNNADRLFLDANGNLGFLSGRGIDFSADSNAAGATSEILNDYEEGTFTPTVIGTSSAGTVNYVVQSGLYTKVGRLVTVQIYLSWTGGTGTGNLSVAGLPFTSGSLNYGMLHAYPINIALTAGYYLGASVNVSNTTVGIFQLPTGGGGDVAVPYDAAGSLLLSGTYTV